MLFLNEWRLINLEENRMPKQQTPSQKRLNKARLTGITSRPSDFKKIVKQKPRTWNIISQGDSWFDFPRELTNFKNANIMDHIVERLYGNANFLRLENIGAEAECLAKEDEFEDFLEGLELEAVDFVLLSMGGNDYAGEDDITRHIIQEPSGDVNDVMSYINIIEFNNTIKKIKNSFEQHINAAKLKQPNAHVITHCYDYFRPSKVGVRILWELIQIIGPWVSIGMKNVPENMQLEIVKWLMDTNKKMLDELAESHDNFYVVDTLGTLRPGVDDDWLNEIHPTPAGFAQLADLVFAQMRELDGSLPSV
jgi:hypothetical protein